MARARRHAPGVRFRTELEPCVIAGVPDRLGRAVNNVLDNAAVFSPSGGVVEVALRDGVLEVRDHGPGAPEEELGQLFDRFFRGTQRRAHGGSGLGLAIVRQVAEAHGATVEAANAPGGGLVVRLAFAPVAEAERPSASSGCLISLAAQVPGLVKTWDEPEAQFRLAWGPPMSATSNTFDDPDDRSEHLRASPPLLPWPMLDRFTRVHPAVPALLYLPVVAVLVGYATERLNVGTLLAWGVVGYGLWTLTEYWLHRVVFHFEPEDGLGAKLHWLIHGVHHEHPNDPNRLVMPPSASIPLAAIFLVLYRVLFGAPAWLAVSAGFLVGYVVYDTMHWYLHHRIPRSRMGRRLRELHLRHHFQDDTRGFGISAPYWDRVFRTAPVSRREAGAAPASRRELNAGRG